MRTAVYRARTILFALLICTNLPYRPPERHRGQPIPRVVIDLDRDPAWRLELVPGIGPSRARRIVAARARPGGGRPLLARALGPALAAQIGSTTHVVLRGGSR